MEDDSYKGFSIKDAGVSRENLEAAFRALPHEMTAVAVDLAGTFLNTIDRLLVGRTLEAAYRADKAAASPADDEDLACYGVLNEVSGEGPPSFLKRRNPIRGRQIVAQPGRKAAGGG